MPLSQRARDQCGGEEMKGGLNPIGIDTRGSARASHGG